MDGEDSSRSKLQEFPSVPSHCHSDYLTNVSQLMVLYHPPLDPPALPAACWPFPTLPVRMYVEVVLTSFEVAKHFSPAALIIPCPRLSVFLFLSVLLSPLLTLARFHNSAHQKTGPASLCTSEYTNKNPTCCEQRARPCLPARESKTRKKSSLLCPVMKVRRKKTAETAPPSKKRKTTTAPVEDAPVAEDEQDEEPAELEENDENGDAKEEAEEVSDDKVETTTEPLKTKVPAAATATEVEGGEEELVAANGDEED
ncbi:hypothetical protein BJ166DRAFT_301417 [Pestalotiopsis sp. NC0098]|nr:hypothetical protein BJ166DRAFT_301417 [Pestalotiopsis sp. NC0098]